MKKLFLITIILLSLVYVGLFAKPKSPTWLNDIDIEYPSESFIAQVGKGISQQDAENDAVSRIARYFESNIDVSSLSTSSITETNTEVQKERSIDTKTLVSSNVSLVAVQYATPYYNKKEKMYYTVAFIDKTQAFELFKPKIEKPAKYIESFFDKATFEDDALLKCKYLQQAKTMEEEFLTQYFFLKILNPEKAENYAEIANSLTTIDSDIVSLIQESTISVVVQNDLNSSVQVATKEGLTSLGYQVKNTDGEYSMLINILLDNQSTSSLTIYYPGIEISLLHKDVLISSTSKTLSKVSAKDSDVAKKRAYQKIAKILKEELLSGIYTTVDSE